MKDLIEKINNFQPKKITIVGDLLLDKYVIGKAHRLNPEAPVPVVRVEKEVYNPGGAGNTAINVKTLGSIPYLIGILGKKKIEDRN